MPTKQRKPAQVDIKARHPSQENGKLKFLGGSASDRFNTVLADQVVRTLWVGNADEDERQKLFSAAIAGLAGIGPKDEQEGMLAAQMIAAHTATMECYRRAMIPGQPFEVWREILTQANKLSRTYATLVETLNRHRGKGQQKVTVEHVHVHEGGQAIVGTVETGGGVAREKGNPVQTPSPIHLSPRCGAKTRSGNPCRSPAMPNGRCRMHGGASPGAPKGKRNGNYRHGCFTNEAIAMRRQLRAWVRQMNADAKAIED